VIDMSDAQSSILQGTLDVTVLKENRERVAGVMGRVLHLQTGS
jgi:hypothetical protein